MTKAGETYVDGDGAKIVEPVYNGAGGTVAGNVIIRR